MDISYSDGSSVINAVISIWNDYHTERAGYYRAFWVSDPDGTGGSPVIGYCSPGGSHRTMRAAISEVRRLGYREAVYRGGRLIAPEVV